MGLESVVDQDNGGVGLFQRVELPLDGADPARTAPGGPHQRIFKEAGGLDASTGHRLRKPYLVGRLAEVGHKPAPAHLELFPGLQESSAGGRVAGVKGLHQHLVGLAQGRAGLLAEGLDESIKARGGDAGVSEFDVLILR